MERGERRVVALGDRAGDVQGQLGVGAAADRDDDPLQVAHATLLDHRDVAGRLAQDLVDRRREGRGHALADGRGLAAPAEDDEVGLELRGDLDDALGGVPPDAHDRVDARALGHEVEDALEQASRVARAGGAF